jgi:hypothetical protein
MRFLRKLYRKTPLLGPEVGQSSNANSFSFEQMIIIYKTDFNKGQDEDIKSV